MLLMVLGGGIVTAFIVHRMVVLMVVLKNVPCVQIHGCDRPHVSSEPLLKYYTALSLHTQPETLLCVPLIHGCSVADITRALHAGSRELLALLC